VGVQQPHRAPTAHDAENQHQLTTQARLPYRERRVGDTPVLLGVDVELMLNGVDDLLAGEVDVRHTIVKNASGQRGLFAGTGLHIAVGVCIGITVTPVVTRPREKETGPQH